jgi:hypothetical protein
MLQYIDNNQGFNISNLVTADAPLNIGIIDADLLDHGTKHPNLALLKISGFCKSIVTANGDKHNVRLICSYDEIRDINRTINEYDIIAVSQVFKFTKRPDCLDYLIDRHLAYYGGTGFFEVNGPNLPDEVEHFMPDYSLYMEFINKQTEGDPAKIKRLYNDYMNYSIGFTTRGCIRQCGFCVNRLLNRVVKWSPIDEFLDPSRPAIYLWDDNIMAAPPKVFKEVMDSLQATNKPFQFRQGMDIRLMTDEKAELLSKVKYHGDYIFAFDHYRMDDPVERKQVEQTIRGLEIWRRHCSKSTKLYVLAAYDSQDEKDIEGVFFRIKTLMEYGCLPYIMRFEEYHNSRFKGMYIQLARWCNQPSFFKKKSFRQYCEANEEYHMRNNPNSTKNCSCFQTMLDFEKEFPEIAEKYFDLRMEDLNRFK